MPSLIGSRWVEGRLANVCVWFLRPIATPPTGSKGARYLYSQVGGETNRKTCAAVSDSPRTTHVQPAAPRKRNRPAVLVLSTSPLEKFSSAHTGSN